MLGEHEDVISFKINRHLFVGIIVGIVIGSLGTVGGAALVKKIGGGGERTFALDQPTAKDTNPQAEPAPSKPVAIKVTSADHIRGNKNAPVVMVEYSDYQCPFCSRHHVTMQSIMKKYGDKVAWVYRHYPLPFHEQAKPAANAAECANAQGKFWEFTDEVFATQDQISGADYFTKIASKLGLDASKFKTCVDAKKYESRIDTDTQEGGSYGVSGTPATFINGVLVSGAVPESEFSKAIESALGK